MTASPIDRWYAKRDPHLVLEATKKKIRGKPRGLLKTVYAQRTLGVLLLARERVDEALVVLDEAASVVRYTGKRDVWLQAAWAAAVALWARAQRGDKIDAAARAKLLKFAKPPAHAAQESQPELWTAERARREVAQDWTKFAADHEPRYALDTMAFHLSQVTFYRQLPVLAPVHAGKLPDRETDAAIAAGLEAIAARFA